MTSTLWRRVREAVRDRNPSELAELQKELDAAGDKSPIHNAMRAQLTLGRNDPENARRMLVKASKKRPLDPHEKLILGLLSIGEPEKAKKLFEQAREAGIDDPRLLEGFGVLAAQAGQLDEGIRLLREAVEVDPKSWSAHFALATALLENGDAAEAGKNFEATAKLRGDFEPAWLGLTEAAIRCNRAAEVSRILGPVARMAPNRENLHLAYARCLIHGGDLRKAVSVLTPWARKSDDLRLLFDYVELCLKAGLPDSARAALARIGRLNPDEPRLWMVRGRMAERMEPRDEPAALAAYKKAVDLDPTNIAAVNALALFLMRPTDHEDYARADALLTEASQDPSPAGWVALSNLALLRRQQERSEEAVTLAKKVVAQAMPQSGAYAQAEKLIAELA